MAEPTPFWTARYPKGVLKDVTPQIEQYKSILEVFEEACGKFPAKPAFTQMGKTITYSELNRKAESFAAFLQNELKLKKGDRLAIQMPNCLQYPIAMYGAIKAGVIVVNVNPLYTEREMKHQVNDAGCAAIVIIANFAHHLQKCLNETKIRHVIVTELGDMLGFPKGPLINAVVKHVKKMVPAYSIPDAIPFKWALEKGAGQTYTRVPMAPEEIAFLQYTGGTTGVAKGAMLTHRNLISNMEQIHTWVSPLLKDGEELAICALPLYHVFALTLHGLALLKIGAQNILIVNPRDLKGYIKEIKSLKFTVMSGVNTLFNGMMNHPDFKTIDFSKVKISVAGGMALQKAVALRWKDLTKSAIIEGYGLTETSPVVCVNPVDGTDRVGTIGLPVPSTLVKMLTEDGHDAPVGEPGELCVKGPQVFKGYWQRPDETAKAFTDDGWFKTGDVAVMDPDGFCRIVDRKKDMIIVSGFNVYPNEVEDVIAGLPGVAEVAAIGVPSERSGEAVKVFIVKKDPSLTEQQVIDFAHKSLTNYKVPKFVEFRAELPKTNVGKILRRALKNPSEES
jgi:long-chain acyl-CoA synthetase